MGGSYYNIPKTIFYLLKGDYRHEVVRRPDLATRRSDSVSFYRVFRLVILGQGDGLAGHSLNKISYESNSNDTHSSKASSTSSNSNGRNSRVDLENR